MKTKITLGFAGLGAIFGSAGGVITSVLGGVAGGYVGHKAGKANVGLTSKRNDNTVFYRNDDQFNELDVE